MGDLAIGSLVVHAKTETIFAALSKSSGLGQLNSTRLRGDIPFWEEFLTTFQFSPRTMRIYQQARYHRVIQ